MSHRKTDLGIPRLQESAKVVLGCHLVFNQADDASDNRAGNATPDRLAGESTDVDIVARPGHHGNERTKVVRDANGQALAYVYGEEESGRRAAAH
jgi:hypothetical protein